MNRWQASREARFWARVDKTGACWTWRGSKTVLGYGQMKIDGRKGCYAHRYSFFLANPTAVDDATLVVRHSCDNPSCVNPAHLSLGTKKDNARDMVEHGRGPKPRITHCLRGHAMEGTNVYVPPKGGPRQCRKCKAMRDDAYNGRGPWITSSEDRARAEKMAGKHETKRREAK